MPGRTSPYRTPKSARVNGLTQKRLFTEGSDVAVGQELYQIDPAPFQAALDRPRLVCLLAAEGWQNDPPPERAALAASPPQQHHD